MLTVKSRAVASVRCADDFEVSRGSARILSLVTWKIFVKTFIIVRVVSRRVGEPSKITLLVVEEGEKRIYRAPFPRFLSLNDAFYAGVKTFFAKKRVRANVDGATRRGGQGWRERNDLGNDLQFLLPAASFFSSYARR